MRRFLRILLITLGVVAIGALGAFGWLAYKVSAAAQRRDELLKNFVRISDDFTNPKVYRHKNFEKRLANLAPPGGANLDHTLGSTFWGISATTSGGIKFGNYHKGIGNYCKLYLNINGSIFGPYREYEDSFGRIRDYITSTPPGTPLRIRGRITYDHDIFQVHGSHDYDLSEEDIEALSSTIELAETFYWRNAW